MASTPDWTAFLSSARALQMRQGVHEDVVGGFVGHLLAIISHKVSYQRLLQQRGTQAQSLIDGLQFVIFTNSLH